MIRGDLVHIPQSAFLLREVDGKNIKLPDGYIKTEKPMKVLFWDRDALDPKWGKIYYKKSYLVSKNERHLSNITGD